MNTLVRLQQIADSGPSLIFLVAFSLILAGFSVYIVSLVRTFAYRRKLEI